MLPHDPLDDEVPLRSQLVGLGRRHPQHTTRKAASTGRRSTSSESPAGRGPLVGDDDDVPSEEPADRQRTAATVATYDRIAEEYAQRSDDDGCSQEFLTWRTGLLSTDGPLVDLGCGAGRDLVAFRAVGTTCLGVDLSTGMLAVAARRGVPVVRGDVSAPPVRRGSLGTVYSCAALLHLPRDRVPATLRAWCAMLRPGGWLHLSTSLGGEEGWELVPYAPDRGPQGGQRLERWFVHHDLDGLLDAVGSAGFVVERVDTRTSHRPWAMVSARRRG